MRAFRAAALAVMLALPAAGDAGAQALGIVSEVKAGVLEHDIDFLGDDAEPGRDINAELLFVSPDLLRVVFAPRPHLGISVNTDGGASQLYAGLTWTVHPFEAGLPGRLWLAAFAGGTVHNGELRSFARDEKSLGTRVLFRLGAEIGVDLTENLNVSIVFEHASNANLADENEGLNNAGVRLGWRF